MPMTKHDNTLGHGEYTLEDGSALLCVGPARVSIQETSAGLRVSVRRVHDGKEAGSLWIDTDKLRPRTLVAMVRMEIEVEELQQARSDYLDEHGKPAPSDEAALAYDLQRFAYDDGGMHGSFNVESVEAKA